MHVGNVAGGEGRGGGWDLGVCEIKTHIQQIKQGVILIFLLNTPGFS